MSCASWWESAGWQLVVEQRGIEVSVDSLLKNEFKKFPAILPDCYGMLLMLLFLQREKMMLCPTGRSSHPYINLPVASIVLLCLTKEKASIASA